MEPREFDLKRRISRDTMTSVVNRGVFTVFGCNFSPIPWGNTSIYDWSHCISRNPPFQVKLSRFHTKLTILNLMNTLFLSKNKFGQIWEKRILRWGKISGIEVFLDFFYLKFTECTTVECYMFCIQNTYYGIFSSMRSFRGDASTIILLCQLWIVCLNFKWFKCSVVFFCECRNNGGMLTVLYSLHWNKVVGVSYDRRLSRYVLELNSF